MFHWWNGLGFRLCLLVTMGMTPLWALTYYDYKEHSELIHSLIREKAFLTAGQVSTGLDLIVETTRRVLTSIARDPAFKKLDSAECGRIMKECYGNQTFLFYTSLGMTDLDGNVICSSIPHDRGNDLPDRDSVRKAADSGHFSVGGFHADLISGKSVLTFRQPVLNDEGKVEAVLFANLDLSWFNRIVVEADLPKESVLTVIDNHGMILSRNIDAKEWIGKSAPDAEIVKACLSRRQGTIEAKGIDGIPKLYGFRPLDRITGSGFVYVGVPTQSVLAQSREIVIRHLIWLAAALILGIAAVWSLSLIFVTKKAAAVIGTSRKLAAGDLSARTGLTLDQGEIGELGCAFDRMAEVLEQRELEQRQTAAGLLREKQFSDTLLESLPGFFYSVDGEGKIVRWNKLLETLSGYSADRISGMKSIEFVVEEDRPKIEQAIQQTFDTGTMVVEARLLTKDGREIPSLFTGKRLEQEGRLLMVGMGIDISERKKAEEDLRRSEATLRSILAASPVGIVVAENRKIKWVNETWKEMFGFRDPGEYMGKDTRMFYQSDSEYEQAGRELYRDLDRKAVTQTDTRSKKKDGTLFETSIRLCRIHSDSQSDQSVVISLEDVSEKRRAERSFQASERRFRDLIENVDLLTVMLDREGNITFCNQSLLRNTGWSRPEVLGQVWFDMFFSSPRGENMKSLYMAAVNGHGGPMHSETKILTKDREERLTKWTTTFLRDSEGTITGSASIGEDITEAKRNEQLLLFERKQLLSIFESMDELVYVIDPATYEILYVNRSYINLLGKDPTGHLCHKELFSSDEICDFCPNEQVMNLHGDAYYWEIHHETLNRDFLLTDKMIRWPDGRQVKFVLAMDITEIRLAEKEVAVSEERMRLLIEKSPIGIGIIQKDHFVYGNPELVRMMGYDSGEEIAGRPLEDFMVPDDCESYLPRPAIKRVGNETTGAYEVQGIRKNGETFDAVVWPRLIDHHGEPSTMVFVADVTESKLLRAQLIQAQKMEAVGTLAGGIAHDFNNLLTIITGYAELLLQDKTPKDAEHGDLVKIYSAGLRGADLVQRLLAFSRKADCKPMPMDLNRQIENVGALLGRTIPKMIAVELNLAQDLETIHADPTQLEQVVINLAVNAKDAMPLGGRLVISTRNVTIEDDFSPTRPEVPAGKYVMLSVSDTGHGVDKDTLQHIFEPFFTTKERGKGTGLGLAMVYGIVQQHRGYIECAGEPGVGTVFNIYFPVFQTLTYSEISEEKSVPLGGNETILLVDDEEMIRELGKKLLKRAGYQVLTAENGREALEIYRIQRKNISLVILDVIMPVMGGKECFEKLICINPTIKVILTSGYTSGGPEQFAEGLGGEGFVKKPFNTRTLLKTVRRALDSE